MLGDHGGARPGLADRIALLGILGGCLALYIAFLLRCELVPAAERCLVQDPRGMDLAIYWTAARLDALGLTTRILDVVGFHESQTQALGARYQLRVWSYPPYLLLLLRPLAWLPYSTAWAVVSVVGFGLFAWACAVAAPLRRWMVGALLLAPATVLNLLTGQNGLLVGALLVGGLGLLGARPTLAGVLFGLATVKPQLGLLIPVALLATRAWRAIASAGATFAVLLGASVWVHGVQVWEIFLQRTLPNNTRVMELGTGVFTWMIPSPFMSGRILGWSLDAAYLAQAAVAVPVVAATWWGCRRTDRAELRTALVCVGAFLVSPYAFNYDMTLLAAASLCVLTRGLDVGFFPLERLGLGLAWLLPLLVMPLNGYGVPIGPVLLLALLGGVLARIERERAITAPSA